MADTTVKLGMLPVNRGSYTTDTWPQNIVIYKDNIVQFNGSSYIYLPANFNLDNPAASATSDKPYDSVPSSLNTGWQVFADGNNRFTTGQTVTNLGIDNVPTDNSTNLVTSGGVKSAIDDAVDSSALRYDEAQTLTDAQKAQALANVGISGIDSTPTAGSENLVTSGGVKSELDDISQYVKGINGISVWDGNLEGDNTIKLYNSATYIVLKVNGGESLRFKKNVDTVSRYALVSSFTFNPALPYSLQMATGERVHIISNTLEVTSTIPSDARYLLIENTVSTGDSALPSVLKINGVDLLKGLDENIASLGTSLASLDSNVVKITSQSLTDSQKQIARDNIDASSKYANSVSFGVAGVGYYRLSGEEYKFVSSSGFNVSQLIPINVGDLIVTNTTINYPYSTALNLFFDNTATGSLTNDRGVAVADFVDGSLLITQSMIDAGYKYVGVSFRLSATPTPSIQVYSIIQNVLSDLQEEVEILKQDVDALSNDKIEIKKVSDSVFKVFIPSGEGKRVCYYFEKHYKKWDSLTYEDAGGNTQTLTDVVSSDYWNNLYIFINDGSNTSSEGYIIQGNTNMIYKIIGANNHVGNGHGCEVTKYLKFLYDGRELDIANMTTGSSVFCEKFRYIVKTDCYATDGTGNTYSTTYPKIDTNGNLIVDVIHYLDALFELGNKITVKNRIQVQRNGIQFYALYDAMLECYFGDFRYIYINNDENTINEVLSDGTTSTVASTVNLSAKHFNLASIAEMYGVNHFVRQMVIPDDYTRTQKQIVNCVYYNDRLKCYFSSVGQQSVGDTGIALETFNAGDSIGCTAIREIELK